MWLICTLYINVKIVNKRQKLEPLKTKNFAKSLILSSKIFKMVAVF